MNVDQESNEITRWLEKAVENYEDDEYEAADCALGIAETFYQLYMLKMRALEIGMMRERHQVEVVKRTRTERALENALRNRQDVKPEPF